MTNPVDANPYEANIENLSYFYSNQLIGVNYTAVSETDFTIGLHTEGNMVVNQDTLGLEQRYQKSEFYCLSIAEEQTELR